MACQVRLALRTGAASSGNTGEFTEGEHHEHAEWLAVGLFGELDTNGAGLGCAIQGGSHLLLIFKNINNTRILVRKTCIVLYFIHGPPLFLAS